MVLKKNDLSVKSFNFDFIKLLSFSFFWLDLEGVSLEEFHQEELFLVPSPPLEFLRLTIVIKLD